MAHYTNQKNSEQKKEGYSTYKQKYEFHPNKRSETSDTGLEEVGWEITHEGERNGMVSNTYHHLETGAIAHTYTNPFDNMHSAIVTGPKEAHDSLVSRFSTIGRPKQSNKEFCAFSSEERNRLEIAQQKQAFDGSPLNFSRLAK